MDIRELSKQLEHLQAEVAQIKQAGNIITDARIDSSKPGGVKVGENASVQYRLRMKGKPAKYLKPESVAEYQAAINRGRQLKRLNREIAEFQQQLDRINAIGVALGFIPAVHQAHKRSGASLLPPQPAGLESEQPSEAVSVQPAANTTRYYLQLSYTKGKRKEQWYWAGSGLVSESALHPSKGAKVYQSQSTAAGVAKRLQNQVDRFAAKVKQPAALLSLQPVRVTW